MSERYSRVKNFHLAAALALPMIGMAAFGCGKDNHSVTPTPVRTAPPAQTVPTPQVENSQAIFAAEQALQRDAQAQWTTNKQSSLDRGHIGVINTQLAKDAMGYSVNAYFKDALRIIDSLPVLNAEKVVVGNRNYDDVKAIPLWALGITNATSVDNDSPLPLELALVREANYILHRESGESELDAVAHGYATQIEAYLLEKVMLQNQPLPIDPKFQTLVTAYQTCTGNQPLLNQATFSICWRPYINTHIIQGQ